MSNGEQQKHNVRISIIAAIGRNRELGGKNDLLWHIPEDFKHFKHTTLGSPIIMGSNTFESIGRALPKRLNIVLSDKPDYYAKGCIVVHSIQEALTIAKTKCARGPLEHLQKECEIFIIGGGFVYKQAFEMGIVDRLYLTLIDVDFPQADVFFPEYEKYGFTNVIEERRGKEEIHQKGKSFTYTFVTVEK